MEEKRLKPLLDRKLEASREYEELKALTKKLSGDRSYALFNYGRLKRTEDGNIINIMAADKYKSQTRMLDIAIEKNLKAIKKLAIELDELDNKERVTRPDHSSEELECIAEMNELTAEDDLIVNQINFNTTVSTKYVLAVYELMVNKSWAAYRPFKIKKRTVIINDTANDKLAQMFSWYSEWKGVNDKTYDILYEGRHKYAFEDRSIFGGRSAYRQQYIEDPTQLSVDFDDMEYNDIDSQIYFNSVYQKKSFISGTMI
jgi:hypothetical protein